LKEPGDQARSSTDALHRIAQFPAQIWQMQAAQVAPLDARELLPEAFTRMQFQGIRWQALHVQPLYGAVGEALLAPIAMPHIPVWLAVVVILVKAVGSIGWLVGLFPRLAAFAVWLGGALA
jgi:uncharacterized membrane protein YphA (DoxX/SURF4 family)